MKTPIMTALAALSILCAAVAPAVASEAGVLVYSHFANAGPLNPHMYSPNQMYAQEMVYEPLVQLVEDGSIQPCLAESWEVSEDGLTYSFVLRKDVVFSDGMPFDAKAVVKNFEHIMANRQRHGWIGLTAKIDSFAATGPHAFSLVLNAPYYPALDDLSLPRPFRFLSPAAFPDDGITRDGIRKPIGTGPWKLAETRLGEYDLFERNDAYWGEPPRLEKVLVKVIPDPISRALALQTGEIDLIYGQGQIGFETFSALRSNPEFQTATSNPVGGTMAAINTNRFPTDDLAVRKALQHACDRDALIKGVFLGTQQRADFLFSPSVPYCDIGLEPYRFDLGLAEQLLDEAGWRRPEGGGIRKKDGRELAVDFCFIGNDTAHKAIAEVLQAQTAQAGIRLNLLGEEEDSFLRRQKDGTFGIIINPTWGPPFEPHTMLASMRRPSHADYQAQLGLPMKEELDRDITRVLETQDINERKELYKKILTTLHEQAVYLPICHTTLLATWRNGVIENFRFGPGKSKYPFEAFGKGK